MKINLLEWDVPWFGTHTGYRCLGNALKNSGADVRRFQPGRGYLRTTTGKILQKCSGLNRRNPGAAWSEAAFLASSLTKRKDVYHFLGEGHLDLYRTTCFDPARSVDTIHQPHCTWGSHQLSLLSPLRHLILLYRRDLDLFAQHLANGSVHFIHHGVDTDYFNPGQPDEPLRLLYNGVHLRNLPMLERVIGMLLQKHPGVKIDALVPLHAREGAIFQRLLANPAISWHSNLNDRDLLALYRRSYLLFLPMNESGANTAVIEALACGLPVVTTEVGGIRDYGGGDIYPIVANNDDEGMTALLDEYLCSRSRRDAVGNACRLFALEHLAWPTIARKHMELYAKIAA